MLAANVPSHVADAKSKVANGEALLVDVREPNEWAEGHFAKAVNVPYLSQLAEGGKIPEELLNANKPLVVHCKMGGRAKKASELLAASGASTVCLSESFAELCDYEFDDLSK
eukprot:CAMPEP_0197292810 /NCGR_PEP_ID=MMETSP0890-20130614/25158_1 /TAXON_ID=44058 ORGANISM="Aureoumbra lagunensis, Strain CCMP1510" /NCGR_SAMPLE_ID=MMETSP0890 /ASSEMBLY_ACC=CAM_ASM_000533 /LENGTH=111 /DNA_ID=CAMNT_0042766985 /DNA_START=132 /DNA_END=467 /DNA_ORIENTATION=+